MKKIIVCFSVFAFHLSFLSAQSFQKGALIIDATYGFDIYSVQEHEVNNAFTPPQTQTKTDGAACGNLNIGGEFGVTNWLGIGLQGRLDSYLHSSNVIQANGVEYGLVLNAHIIRHQHFDFLAGLNLGLSSLILTFNDGYSDQIYGKGSWTDIHITSRIYFGKFGVGITLYFPTINYATLTSNNSIFNEYILDSWKAKGSGLNFGVQYHFLQ